jgi:Tol biopolymer transport system component
MRSTRIAVVLSCGLLACGGGGSDSPDAAVHHDAPAPDTSSLDAPTDTPSDAPPAAGGRIWIGGDWVTDGLQKIGSVPGNATAMIATANVPVIPGTQASVDELGSGSLYFVVFDLNAAGTKVAYVADSTVAARFDLFSANADGTNAVTVYQAPATVEIGAIAMSPDGTKIAFMADIDLDGMQDIYVVPNTAASTPVRVSPARVANDVALDAFRTFTWSRDSRYLAFSGAFTQASYDEVYVRDTMANTTAAALPRAAILVDMATAGAKGIRGAPLFDAMNRVYFRANIQAVTTPVFELFRTAADGTGRAALALPARTDTTTSQVGAFQISPDGMKIAFSADAPIATAYEIYASALDLATPTRLTSGTVRAGGNAEFTTPLWWSPDGTKVAFTADFETEGEYEPYVATVATAASAIRLVSLTVANTDCDAMAWAQTNDRLFCQGDLVVNNDTSLFALSPTMADQTPALIVTVPTGGDLNDLKSTP